MNTENHEQPATSRPLEPLVSHFCCGELRDGTFCNSCGTRLKSVSRLPDLLKHLRDQSKSLRTKLKQRETLISEYAVEDVSEAMMARLEKGKRLLVGSIAKWDGIANELEDLMNRVG